MTTILTTPNSQIFRMSNGVKYWVAKCEGCGWYVEGKDGYVSEYYSAKKSAISRLKEIDTEIKKGNW